MARSGPIRRRLALAIVLTALIPVLVAIALAKSMVSQATARFFVPELTSHLDRSLGLYQELARTVKALLREKALAISLRPGLRAAALRGERGALGVELQDAFADHPDLALLEVRDPGGELLSSVSRDKPFDAKLENELRVTNPLADGERAPELLAVFARDKARFDELLEMSQFVDAYKQLEQRRTADERSYLLAFAALLGITILAAVGVGAALARGVALRVGELARVTALVGAGDLSIRVPERGSDEISDLARAFNRMLAEVEVSRARTEYLRKVSALQEIARRLAHEIKNPLTPIQLAVEEIHRRFTGADPAYRKLLDTTLEIVEDEVGTLRRLVGEFSEFARLPQASLAAYDMALFLKEQRAQLELGEEEREAGLELLGELESRRQELSGIRLRFDIALSRAPVLMDRQMLRRVLINLVKNAADAVRARSSGAREILVRLTQAGKFCHLDVDDNGPGIPEGSREAVFDPYISTKSEGAGLGLAIVKKIVVEHGGSISIATSELGGARFRVSLPLLEPPLAASGQPEPQTPEVRT